MIPESWDQAPHQAPWSAGSLLLPLPLPAALPACTLSLCQINKNKILKKKKKKFKNIFFREMSIQVHCSFLNWVVFLLLTIKSSLNILDTRPLSGI